MIPRSLSASSIAVFSLCPARWQAENHNRVPQEDNMPALVGTAVHGGLENYVQKCYIDKVMEPTWTNLKAEYYMSYVQTFGSADDTTDWFKDGLELTEKWFKRTSFADFQVISTEKKKHFDVPYEHEGQKKYVPYNYIMDRMDMLPDGSVRVVDYKTIRVPLSPDELRNKIQARSYGLAAQIEYPEAPRIYVEFDLLRHDTVGVVFTREENKATWRYLKAEAQRIVDTPNVDVPEKLNSECRYCPRKSVCATLNKNIDGGGIQGIAPNDAVEMKYRIQSQMKGLETLVEELDTILLMEAVNRDELEWDTPFGKVEIKASRRRQAQTAAIAEIIGPDLTKKYGSMTLGNIDAMLKGTELTEEQKVAVKACVSWGQPGDPKPKITPASPIEE